jgi:hypothetical protein
MKLSRSSYKGSKVVTRGDYLEIKHTDSWERVSLLQVEWRSIKNASVHEGRFQLSVNCAVGACVTFIDSKKEVQRVNYFTIECGEDMTARLIKAFNHLGAKFGRKQAF